MSVANMPANARDMESDRAETLSEPEGGTAVTLLFSVDILILILWKTYFKDQNEKNCHNLVPILEF